MLWQKALGSARVDELTHLIPTDDGEFLAAGATQIDGDLAPWLVRFDADGNVLWQASYDLENADEDNFQDVHAGGLTLTSDGNIAMTLATARSPQGDSSTTWSALALLVVSPDGDVVRALQYDISANLGEDIVGDEELTLIATDIYVPLFGDGPNEDRPSVMHLNAQGQPLWILPHIGSNAEAILNQAHQDEEGSIYVAGWYFDQETDGIDPWAIKFDPAGTIIWQRRFAAPHAEQFEAIEIAPNGDLLLITNAFEQLEDDAYTNSSHILRLNPTSGQLLDTQSFSRGENNDLTFYGGLILDNTLTLLGETALAGANLEASLLRAEDLNDFKTCVRTDAAVFTPTNTSVENPVIFDTPEDFVTPLTATRVALDDYQEVATGTASEAICPL
ncbi:hypothetical protein FRC98_09735 [Lujinxingia vulgaris]|uniref:Uncharacterized protein n=1 Tax=Lujinxingia vulgaris TaxID=2600176 RepID=A0A5C6XIB3_9DELT|nr:hypothetical protein [Lujinxingia vulgaris]TXD37012.1 hypothetical protein FRC98_09735 [Lujinxingia vulgaris]